MYTFYKDKSENFECNIKLEGANLSKTQVRLVLENNEYPLIFNGNIDSTGKCIIPIPKLKILSEELKGNLKLEVIVDEDTFFTPYSDVFEIAIDKKVTVEVINKSNSAPIIQETKKKVTAVVTKTQDQIINEILNEFDKNKITIFNINESKKAPLIIKQVINNNNVDKNELLKLQEALLNRLIEDLQ
jgi:hypothetical protein